MDLQPDETLWELEPSANVSQYLNYTENWSYQMNTSLLHSNPYLTYFILVLYGVIFLIGAFGNMLVLYVVIRYKSMRTITNKFITCLSVSDLLMCLFAIPFTPMNALMTKWIFGQFMCRLIAIILVINVFVSTLTSVVIAVDIYMIVVHPHTPRMSSKFQLGIIIAIWIMAASTALPLGLYTTLDINRKVCTEKWPNEQSAKIYTVFVMVFQVLLPATIITVCYSLVSHQLQKRTSSRINSRDSDKEKLEEQRNRKINRMLVAMVTLFIISWLPLDIFHLLLVLNIVNDSHVMITFLFCHIAAMSSIIYNPFLYGWMNENFNRHFKEILQPIASKFSCNKRANRLVNGERAPCTQATIAPPIQHTDKTQNKMTCHTEPENEAEIRLLQDNTDLQQDQTDLQQNQQYGETKC